MSYDTARPHIASYVLLRKDGKMAFVLRANTDWMNNYYGLPSGKVEDNESFESAAIREAKEEVGIDIKKSDLKHALTAHRFNKDDHAPIWVDVIFEVSKWQGEVINAEPHVHSELAWLDPNNLPDNVIPSVAEMLQAIKDGKNYCEIGWS